MASNAHYSCLHSRPRWPDIPAGEERAVLGKYYFLKGGPDDLLKRHGASALDPAAGSRTGSGRGASG